MNQRRSERSESSGRGQDHAEGIHGQGPDDVEPDDASHPSSRSDGADEVGKVRGDEDDVGRSSSYLGTGAHAHPNGGCRKSGSVVDAITNHDHLAFRCHEFRNHIGLFNRTQSSTDLVNTDLIAHLSGCCLRISRQHDDLKPHAMQLLNCCCGRLTNLINELDCANPFVVHPHV